MKSGRQAGLAVFPQPPRYEGGLHEDSSPAVRTGLNEPRPPGLSALPHTPLLIDDFSPPASLGRVRIGATLFYTPP